MRILILTAWYAPFIHPRAHRWAALAEHWAAQGQEVHVVCGRVKGCARAERSNGVWVHRAGFDSLKEWLYHWRGHQSGRGRVGAAVQAPSRAGRLLVRLHRSVWKNLCFPDDAMLWYLPALRAARRLQRERDFDAIITVSLPFTGHLVGKHLKRDFPSVRWLADIGDPFSFSPTSLNNTFLFGSLNRRMERQVLLAADGAVVTDEAVLHRCRQEFGEAAAARMVVIPPLLTGVFARAEPASQPRALRLGFFGAMYAPVRSPDTLLGAVERWLEQDARRQIELHIYGEVFPEFYARLAAHAWVHLHGLRSREEVRAAMQRMDVLVNLGNQSDFQLPSKVVDYLASGKPILNVSHAYPDPFADFLSRHVPDERLVFHLRASGGRVGEEELQRCMAWLEAEKPRVEEEQLEARLAPFRVEAVGRRYLDLLGLA
ncbi:MAG TPA: glycosyltransferase [Saprospiraceae bacterium]|nr:glycosyltransferase [Saprospiraceae bacterium]HND89586.1 glycosyltransferase [Saprospiraceae bacterium]